MPEQQTRRFYNIPIYVKENLAIMIAEYSGITNAHMANSYYENLRDRIGILGFTHIPTADSPDRREYLNRLNRFSTRPITGLRILTFEAFRRWSLSPRFRTITIDALLDEMEDLASDTAESQQIDMELVDSDNSEEYETPQEIINERIIRSNPPSLIIDRRSNEIVNQADIDDDNIDCIIIFPNIPTE